MRVLEIGGIFGQTPEFRATNLQTTTETLLVDHLPSHGIEVSSQAHSLRNDLEGFDVVHVHHLANSCVPLTLRKPIPMVFTRHALGKTPALHAPVLAATQCRADALVALSDVEARLLDRRHVRGRVQRIYNAVDPTVFHGIEKQPPSGGERWRLLYVGQLIDLKRPHIAVQVLASLVKAGHDAELALVSHRPTLQPQLEALARDLGVGSRVEFVGALGQVDVAAQMRSAHALLLPSETESLPTVVTEALLSSLPVLTFDVGGVQEQLPEEIHPPPITDEDRYMRASHHLLDEYAQMAAVFAGHRAAVATRFSIDAMVSAHAELYRSLV